MNFFEAITSVLEQNPVLFIVTMLVVSISAFAFVYLLFQYARGGRAAATPQEAVAPVKRHSLQKEKRKKRVDSPSGNALRLPRGEREGAPAPLMEAATVPAAEIIVHDEQETFTREVKPVMQPVTVVAAIAPAPVIEKIVEAYPLLRLPVTGTEVTPAQFHHRISRGYAEAGFEEKIKRAFPHLETASHHCLPFGNGAGFGIDILLQGTIEDEPIYIDIEIDEPYDALQRIPMHCLHADAERDDFFVKRGWIVVRFTERQVTKEPVRCLAAIARIIHERFPAYEVPHYLEALPPPAGEPQWTTGEAAAWQRARLREQYLGIERWNA